jgi:putative protease
VAAVTRVYRAALDAYRDNPGGYRFDPEWLRELEKVSHRPYGEGFLFGNADARIHPEDSGYRRSTDFVGVVLDNGGEDGWLVQGRNRFECGEQLELIGPGMRQADFAVAAARTQDGQRLTVIQPNSLVKLDLPPGFRQGDILRRNH